MELQQALIQRSNSSCELCGSKDGLQVYEVHSAPQEYESHILVCETCQEQIENPEKTDPNHWRCLNDSMWSQVPAVQVMAWRMLDRLKDEGWPQDLLDMIYLEDEVRNWAKAGISDQDEASVIHRDSNGTQLENGDTVVLIKDLPVKGSSMVAKRGTAVRRISLVHDNPDHIEGRVDGQQIVILTKFVKKS